MEFLSGEKVLWQNSPDDSRTNVVLTESNVSGIIRLSHIEDGETVSQIPMLGNKMLKMAEFILSDAYGNGEVN